MPDYSNLEKVLYRGFLTTELEIASVPIVLKSLNPSEYDLIDLHSYSTSDNWKENAAYALAYATLFFNHVNILPVRDEVIPTLVSAYQDLPDRLLVAIIVAANSVNLLVAKLLRTVQAYSYGPGSRQMWTMIKGQPLNDERLTGFPGSSLLGMNPHQRLWVYFNSMEDQELGFQQQYQIAKFIVSPHAPKDVQRIDQKDRQRTEEREAKRTALFEGRESYYVGPGGQIRLTNESAEELLEQMEMAVRGEKDYHDLIIEEHQRKVREAYEYRKAQEEQAREAAFARRQQREEEEYDDGIETTYQSFEGDEVQHYLAVADEKRRARIQGDSPKSLQEMEHNLTRWGFIHNEVENPAAPKPRNVENPLISEHYERVSEDLGTMKSPPPQYPKGEE